jgi:hypothetical protein
MLHDGGGDRSRTVAAVAELINELKRRGYTFDTVSFAVDAPPPWHPATTYQRLQGSLVGGLVRISDLVVWLLKLAFAILAVLTVLRTVLLTALARRHVRSPLTGQPCTPGSAA